MARHTLLALSAVAGWCIWAAGQPVGAQETDESDREVVTLQGQPMTVWPNDDLRRRGFDIADVPRDEAAFWVYLEAVNSYPDVPEDVREAYRHAYGIAWPKGHDAKLKAFLLDGASQKALSLARQASAMEKFGPVYFGDPNGSVISMLLRHLSAYRELSKMLVADGRRLEEQGAPDLAFRNYVAAMRMGHHISQGITLIDGVVGVACWYLGDKAIREMVLRRDLRPEQLRGILKNLNELYSLRPSLVRGIENEKCFGSGIVDELTSQPTQFLRNLRLLSGCTDGSDVRVDPSDGWRRLEARIGQLILPDRTIKRHMAGYYDQLVELSHKAAYDPAWRQFDEEAAVTSIPHWNVLARTLLPSLSRACTQSEWCRMGSQATRLAVALRLFAAEHKGAPPVQLAEVYDRVPAEDLIDPFSGREFVYKRNSDAWMFYSFSENMVDDDGKPGDRLMDFDYVVRFPPPAVEPFEPEDNNEN